MVTYGDFLFLIVLYTMRLCSKSEEVSMWMDDFFYVIISILFFL